MSPRARRSVIAGIVALCLALGGLVLYQVLQPATCSRVISRPIHVRSVLPPGVTTTTTGERRGLLRGLANGFRTDTGQAVFCRDFADPSVLVVGNELYAYATTTGDANVPVLRTLNPAKARYAGDALPKLAAWAVPRTAWAPAALRWGGQYLLYYAAQVRGTARHCISVAVAHRPVGPFVDRSAAPLVCPLGLGGAIDPYPFVNRDGRLFLLWKNDGNCCGVEVRLWSQLLSSDGRRVVAPATPLLAADQPWEAGIIENPAIVEDGGVDYLFFSANVWNTPFYAIGYAVCRSVAGPCVEHPGPWLASNDDVLGPGGESFYRFHGRLFMVFHAWLDDKVGYPRGVRNLFVASVTFVAGTPVAS